MRSWRQAQRHPPGLPTKRIAPPPYTAPTTKHCTPASTHSPQTTSNHKHKHKARITHTHTESRVRPRFSDLMMTWFSSHKNTEDCTYSPQKNKSPTCRKVGTLSADPTLVVCPQNMTNKAMIADESKGDLGHLFYVPTYSYRWDHTLGYEGEGPPLHLVSLNVNGVLSNDTWRELLNLAQFLKIDILCLQETNIADSPPAWPRQHSTATRPT